VSRRTLIVGGTSAIVGAGVGAGVARVLTADRTGPTLWQRGDRAAHHGWAGCICSTVPTLHPKWWCPGTPPPQ